MAIFTESTCLNWFHESENHGINFANKYVQIQDSKNILDDNKIVSTINSAFPKFKAAFTKVVKDNFNEFYHNPDGSYEYNMNTPEKVLKLAYLSWILINTNKHKNNQIFGYITWEPESPKYRDIISILQLKKGFIDEDDCMSLYFNIKDDPTSSKRMLNFYIEFSHSGNMRITDIDFDR